MSEASERQLQEEPPGQRSRILFAAVLFLVSGFSALLYQVIWQRILGIFSGVHIYSVTLIVTAFMVGLGLGSLLGGRFGDRLARRASLLAFAGCELVIGLFALASPTLYYDIAYLRLGHFVQTPALLPAVHFALLLLPTLLMGASLPLLARAVVPGVAGAARTIALLYGLNTAGAALGAATASWLLIGSFGFVGTIQIGAVGNILVAAGALVLLRSAASDAPQAPPTQSAPAVTPPNTRIDLRGWCLIYALAGFVALSLELLWFRLLDVTIKSSPYTFGHLLAFFLGFLALGSLFAAVRVQRWKQPERIGLWCLWGVTAWFGFSLAVFFYLPLDAMGLDLHGYWTQIEPIRIYQVLEAFESLSEPAGRDFLGIAAQVYLLQPFLLMAVPTFLMGVAFACIQRSVQTDLRQVGWRVGAIQTANIAGSILGSVLTGTVLLHFFGSSATSVGLILSGGVFAVLLGRVGSRGLATAAVLTSVALSFAVPGSSAFWARFHTPDDPTLFVAEDASGVAAIQEIGPHLSFLRVNGNGHSRLPFGDEHTLFGLIPVLLHPNIENALVIGLGSGNTAWAVAASPALKRADVYEIVRPEIEVISAWEWRGRPYRGIQHLLKNPEVQLHYSDGRLALRLEDRLYDLIQADALEPSMAFSGNLYSKEFFELARSRLAPDGILSTYVPTERTLRTLVQVFPYVLDFHAPEFASFAIASNQPIHFDSEAIIDALVSPPVKAYLRASSERVGAVMLVRRYLRDLRVEQINGAAREPFLKGDVNSDLFPRDEFDVQYRADYQ